MKDRGGEEERGKTSIQIFVTEFKSQTWKINIQSSRSYKIGRAFS
jgi:hypothetical protein